MKSIIPFTKELEFNTKVSEITSISLERDFALEDESIEGNLHITGEYKSHEVSVNVIPFSFKIPFSIAVSKKIDKDSLSLEISDFAYDTLEDNKIKVHVELELSFVELNDEEEIKVLDNSEEIIGLMEDNRYDNLNEMRNEITMQEEQALEDFSIIEELDSEEKSKKEELENQIIEKVETIEEVNTPSDITEDKKESEIMEEQTILSSNKENEYMTYHIHILKEGEGVETLCTLYKVTGEYLAEYNDITNLTVGDKVLIPIENE